MRSGSTASVVSRAMGGSLCSPAASAARASCAGSSRSSSRERDRDRERRRRRRGARPPRLAGSRQHPLRARRRRRRGARLGRADETWQAMEVVAGLGGEAWFRLGDRDLGLHLVRTQALRSGEPLSAVTARLAHGPRRRGDAAARHRRSRCGRGSTRRRARSRFQEWFVARRTGTRSTACASTARRRRRPRPACSTPSPAPS